ncbi:DUF58 domain-containing protein [Natribacillus halophilus]|uniref:Uncharacterized conserved protein, DUF58 family, contains vWF domain n=1 Tax=Natribacillus halophilus TaxID=549003 RepID=A0A1G8QHA6_9BACI|nr:DUF58 domain-containing protein [Natribacillus halophilus]SDJ03785.1 Uncharacterized conserved protein, DUF58 family, contains vWF domain [Natribacillus halophilus]
MNRHVETGNATEAGLILFALITFVAFLSGSYAWFALAAFGFIWMLLSQRMLRSLGRNLELFEKKQRHRYFIGHDGYFTLTLKNDGPPIFQCVLTVDFDGYVQSPSVAAEDTTTGLQRVATKCSIGRQQSRTVTIPFTAHARGIARVRAVSLKIPNWTGLGNVHVELDTKGNQEAVVLPGQRFVAEQHRPLTPYEGAFARPYALYRDRLMPTGVRNYEYGDDFKDIHWKASAKMQQLQTKQYETVSDQSMLVSVNLSDGYGITGDLDALIEHCAYLAFVGIQNDLEIGLAINRQINGGVPYLFTPPSGGEGHLAEMLEQLASITKHNTLTIPYAKMIADLMYRRQQPAHWIHVGRRLPADDHQLRTLEKKGQTLSTLERSSNGEAAYLAPYTVLKHREEGAYGNA